jgi:hypothetical protein
MLKKLLSPQSLYRASAAVFLLYALGHTAGFLGFSAPTEEGRAVFASMSAVSFDVDGKWMSYGGFYEGFGLMGTTYKLFCAFVSFYLGHLAAKGQQGIRSLGWALAALQCAGLYLSLRYFVVPPVVLSALLVILLTSATVQIKPSGASDI